jgi:hypothetical protein
MNQPFMQVLSAPNFKPEVEHGLTIRGSSVRHRN